MGYRIARVRDLKWDLEKTLNNQHESSEAKEKAVKKDLVGMRGGRLITHMNVRMTSTLCWTVFVIFWQCRVLMARDSVEGLLQPYEGFKIRFSIFINSYFAITAVFRLEDIRRLLEEFQNAKDLAGLHPGALADVGNVLLLRRTWARRMAFIIVLLVFLNLAITFGTLDVCNNGIRHVEVFNPLSFLRNHTFCAPLKEVSE